MDQVVSFRLSLKVAGRLFAHTRHNIGPNSQESVLPEIGQLADALGSNGSDSELQIAPQAATRGAAT
jgi:hypothetical protein